MDVFVRLAESPRQLVSRDELLDTVWGGSTASDEQLTRAIGELRRALDDDRVDPKYIETVPKRGYRLIRDVDLPDGDGLENDLTRSQPVFRLTKHKLTIAAVSVLTLGLTYFMYNEFAIDRARDAKLSTAETQPESFSALHSSSMSIAVLPFVNMSDDPGAENFADGLSEEIRNLVARIPDLRVIGRTSSSAFLGKNEDVRVIGRTLGVKTVLEGSVQKSGNRLRITAQLIDISDGSYIWSDSYDRTMTEIFELQDDVATAIIDALQIHIATKPTRGRPTEVPEAYALFLKARADLNVQDHLAAISELRQAIELDRNFVEAHELLAHAYWTQYMPEIDEAEAQKLMRAAAAGALAIDPDRVFARALYQAGNTDDYSLPAVIEAFMRAARERPNDPSILRTLTWELLITGYLDEALRAAERFVEVDPLSSIAHIRHAAVLRANGFVSESIAALEAAAPLTPGGLDWYRGEIHLVENLDEAAIKQFEAYVRDAGGTDVGWVRELVTNARDPATGPSYLDQRIPAIVESEPFADRGDFEAALNRWHLFFGHLDRYFEIIIDRNPNDAQWTDVGMYLWYGTVYRDRGFTAHPKYPEVADMMGYVDVWEQRGAPDYCNKDNGQWVCF